MYRLYKSIIIYTFKKIHRSPYLNHLIIIIIILHHVHTLQYLFTWFTLSLLLGTVSILSINFIYNVETCFSMTSNVAQGYVSRLLSAGWRVQASAAANFFFFFHFINEEKRKYFYQFMFAYYETHVCPNYWINEDQLLLWVISYHSFFLSSIWY